MFEVVTGMLADPDRVRVARPHPPAHLWGPTGDTAERGPSTTDPAPSQPGAAPGRLRRLFLDTAPLRRDRDYRWLWSGQVVNGIGQPDHPRRLPFQVYVLDRLDAGDRGSDALPAGPDPPLRARCRVAGGCRRPPEAADGDPGRTGGVQRSPSSLLALTGAPPLWALFAVAFVAAGCPRSTSRRARRRSRGWCPPERLPSAIALNQLNFQMASIVGPAVGGILIATVGLAGAYTVDLVSFVASLSALLAIRPLPPLGAVDAARARGDPPRGCASPAAGARSWVRS